MADPEADLPEITDGYRRQMTRNGGNRIKQAELTRVYEVLADAELRYAYDATRAEPCEEGAEVRATALFLGRFRPLRTRPQCFRDRCVTRCWTSTITSTARRGRGWGAWHWASPGRGWPTSGWPRSNNAV